MAMHMYIAPGRDRQPPGVFYKSSVNLVMHMCIVPRRGRQPPGVFYKSSVNLVICNFSHLITL